MNKFKLVVFLALPSLLNAAAAPKKEAPKKDPNNRISLKVIMKKDILGLLSKCALLNSGENKDA